MNPTYRIHGDNIIECEVATNTILESIKFSTSSPYELRLISSSAVTPAFSVKFESGLQFVLEFFPGHNRWDTSLADYLVGAGAPLKESVDAFITLVDGDVEKPIVAFEFSNALPAGNNAWQRAGRALSMIQARIPYFYFAEIGGQELDANREIKAPRFPNPIVPFSYVSVASAAPEKCTTVYLPSRSISEETYDEFKDTFGDNDYKRAIAALFTGDGIDTVSVEKSKEKSARFVNSLVQKRRRGTYSAELWSELLLNAQAGKPIAPILTNSKLAWTKKISIPSNPTLSKLLAAIKVSGVTAIGSTDMPFCILPASKRHLIAQSIKEIYGKSVSDELVKWLNGGERDLVLVFVAGFKPRGDDSRPDRGLVPLARMVFANDDVDILSIVYGPAKLHTWSRLFDDPFALAANNGLWEAVIGLGNALLVDSKTLPTDYAKRDVVLHNHVRARSNVDLARFDNIPRYGEHDVDSTLHLLFSDALEQQVYEALCNPPGGDWSGISLLDSEGATNRWTSLPRVTGIDGKRPDHIIQFFGSEKVILSIESKDFLRNLEENIGPRLDHYTHELLSSGAAQSRRLKDSLEWSQTVDVEVLKSALSEYRYISGAAVMGDKDDALNALAKSNADICFALSFKEDSTRLYFAAKTSQVKELLLGFIESQKTKLELLNITVTVLN